jgi:hypothetical protein
VADCTSFINDIFFNPVQAPGVSVIADCTVTTNQRNGVVSYAEGGMGYSGRTTTHPPRWRAVLGVRRQFFVLPYYFSDRRGPVAGAPFKPTAIDDLGLEVALLGNNDQLGITFTLLSWGNAKFTIQVVGCDAGVVYGVGAGIGAAVPNALYAIWVGRLRQGGFL